MAAVPSGVRSQFPLEVRGAPGRQRDGGAWGTGSRGRARLCRVFSSGDIGAESSPEVALLGRLAAQMLEASAISQPRSLHAGAPGPKLSAFRTGKGTLCPRRGGAPTAQGPGDQPESPPGPRTVGQRRRCKRAFHFACEARSCCHQDTCLESGLSIYIFVKDKRNF